MEEEEQISARHETRLRVRYAETDQMGVVYHANYLVWMEIGRVELVRSLGLNYRDLEQFEGLFLAVVDVNCRYHFPARYDQEIIVRTHLADSNPRMVKFGYEIRLAEEDRLLVEASTRHIWLNKELRPSRLPDRYLAALQVR